MHSLRLTYWVLLLGSPLPSLAQTSSDTPATPRYYVGLGAYSSFYQSLGHASVGSNDYSFRLPVQLTAGYQLSPRLAVQVGVAYSSTNYHYDQWLRLWLLGGPPNAARIGGRHRGKFEDRAGYQIGRAHV